MGDVIVIGDRLEEHSALRLDAERPAFYFDLACPFSYLAAERVERLLGEVEWVPLRSSSVGGPAPAARPEEAEERARVLRLPIVWPERYPRRVPGATRAAAYACEGGAGARFAIAAFRLAFCGGYDVDDPGVLSELAASVGIPGAGCLEAAADPRRDDALEAAARGLGHRGVRTLPGFRVGDRWFEGEHSLLRAAALQRERRQAPMASLA
jgi:2-hydroxychromene-2-carboxylate isomerase